MGPTRPKSMVALTISFPATGKAGVRARLSPTVAVALTVSYKRSAKGACTN